MTTAMRSFSVFEMRQCAGKRHRLANGTCAPTIRRANCVDAACRVRQAGSSLASRTGGSRVQLKYWRWKNGGKNR
jgi:hypothetical protein